MPATDLERLVVSLSADFKAFEKGLARAQGVSNRQFAAIERRASQLDARLNSIGRNAAQGLIAPLSGLGAALGTREITKYADAWTEAGNKIRAAATSAGVNARSLNLLKEGANNARTDLSAYVDLYARLIRSASGVVKSEQDIADMTNIVAKAFKAGGASASEQAAGILQLGQALGSGVLQGDELRSLRENAPILAQAIATEFKTTIAGLKKLGADGELVSHRVAKAILAAQKPIEAQFKATNATIQDAITRVNNEFLAYIGNADASAGASQKLVEALQYLSDNFGAVADTIVQFATVIIGALTGRAILGMVAGLGNAVVALGAFVTALRAGTLAAAGFTAALGPIGLLAGAAAAAIYVFGDSQSQAEKAADAHQAMLRELQFQIANVDYANGEAVASTREKVAADIKAAEVALERAIAEHELANALQAVANQRASSRPGGRDYSGFGVDTSKVPTGGSEVVAQNIIAPQVDRAATKVEEMRKRVEEIKGLSADFEDYASGKKKPERSTSGFGGGSGAAADKDGKSKSRKKTAQDRLDEDIQAIRDRTAALLQEQELVGKSYYEQEKRRAALDLEQEALKALREEARKKGVTDLDSIKLSNAQVAAIDAAAEAYARQADALRKVEERQERIEQAASDAYDAFKTGAMDAIFNAESLGDALQGVLKRLAEIALSNAFDSLFKPVSGGSSGGAFGGIFGAIGKILGFDEGGYTGDGAKMQPKGVVHGGEYVFSKAAVQKAGVANLDAMHRNLKGFASGGYVGAPVMPRIQAPAAQAATTVNMPVTINAPGADAAALERVRAEVKTLGQNIPKMVDARVFARDVRRVRA